MKLTRLAETDLPASPVFLAVSIDSHDESHGLIELLEGKPETFPIRLLEDRERRVIDRYGLRNAANRKGIPHPATFVIDRAGVVRWRFVETDYTVRAANEDILAALRELTP